MGVYTTSQYYAMYGNTTLHTNYNYFRANQFLKKTSEVLHQLSHSYNAIEKMQAQENKFYANFGCNNYQEFILLLRKLMDSSDGDLLRRASNKNIQTLVSKIIANQSGQQDLSDIKLSIRVKGDDVGKKLEKALSQLEGVSQISSVDFSIIGNTRNMKILANKLASKHYHIFTGQTKKGSLNNKALEHFFRVEGGLDELIEFSYKGQAKTSFEISELIKPRPFPWGYRRKELKELVAANPEVWEPKFQEALNAIEREVLLYFSGGSANFQKALKQTINETLNSESKNIFFVGEDIRNGLLGAFGEFGTSLLINYVYIMTGKSHGEKEAQIIGYSNGKQDVLFDGFGIQVKNYSIDGSAPAQFTRREIEVNQQPVDVAEYFTNSQSFLGFMANYFFNDSIQQHASFVSLEDLCLYLAENMQGELMRLAVSDIKDTVSFYNIGQQFFVPGSALLSMYINTGKKLKVTITNNGGAKWTGGVSQGPNDYWTMKNSIWYPTKDNYSAFDAAISKNISITASLGRFELNEFAY